MNNGKVRIYELSKELNLENKDIKDICEQLNITVKSHSSTITDSQAERVRAIAAKYTPETTAKNNLKERQNSQNKGKKKPQILAIHHKNNSSEATTAPTLAGPPKLPTKASSTLQNQSSSVSPKVQLTSSPKITAQTPSSSSIEAESTTIESPNFEAAADQRQLVSPPSRPQLNKTASKSNKVVQLNKKTEIKTLAAPSLPKLQKPPKFQNSETELEVLPDESEEKEKEDGAVLDGDELELDINKRKPKKDKLKRPNPPRKLKDKTWEDEEEDVLEQKAKSAAKGKRRPKPIVDDEEDEFGNPFESAAATTAIGLSIARPPKPKSEQVPAQKPAATTKNKPKKSSSKADKASKAERRNRKTVEATPETIEVTSNLTVRELADLLKMPETDIIRNLFFKGIAVNITQTLDFDTARLVAQELGVAVDTPEAKSAATKETEMLNAEDLENLVLRPPVVTIMGHVDHGKTTLLDSIRKSKVAQGEAGGITQHIGAYHVDIEHEGKQQQIVFLDTPGHEAFTAMRARGTRVTDIAILVVAADDGVQPQTKEAISHAKAAEVPLIVAINKVDKPEANPDRIKQELTEQGLVPEDWGGDTTMVEVSALKGDNLDELLEMIVLVSEIEELSANPNRPAKGTVIEAHLDRTRGPVATLLVQNGTLRVGDSIVAGAVFGKIRAMIDDRGDKVEAATPSFAVEVLGLGEVPEAGDEFDVYLNEKDARAIADANSEKQRDSRLQQSMSSRRVSLTSLSAQAQEGELKELNLILKSDVQGSVEAILGSLQQIPQNEVQIRVLLASPGEVTETDVDLAAASGAVIIGFNTTLASGARQSADNEGVDIRQYNIIYKLLDDIQGAMEGLLDPEEVEEPLGQVEVRAVFNVGRGSVAGCYVLSGKIIRNCKMRVRRNSKVIYEGNLDSLKRMKEDSREVNAGYECGIGSNKFNDWQEGDLIEAYEMTFKRRTLSGNK
jgi:translation initiation factor IF-2